MIFDEIMAEITAGLTGNPEDDKQYLILQIDKYKKNEYANEIARAIGRILYKLLSNEERKEVCQIFDNLTLGIETSLEEAEFQMYKNNYNKALEIIEPLIAKIEEKGWYKSDSVSDYRCFDNIFEEIIYKEIFKPSKDVRKIPENYTKAYYIYGIILFELKKYNEARKILEKANEYNPVSTDVLFELSETYKVKQEWDGYLRINNDCLKYAYSSKALARCYRNYGFYFIEKTNYDMAAMLFFLSMNYDEDSKMAQSELLYISKKTGEMPHPTSIENTMKLLKIHNIQSGANQLILGLAYSIAKVAQESKNNNMAKNFYEIFYDLTKDDEIKNIIDSLDEAEDTRE